MTSHLPSARSRWLPAALCAALGAALGAMAGGAGPAAAELPPEGGFAPEAWVAAEDGVPVRSDPGFVYREIGHLRANQEVLVDTRQGQWLRVRPEGWVFADHLRRPEATPAVRRIRVLKEGARIRQGPGTEHPVVDTLVTGQELILQEELAEWWLLGPERYLFKSLAEEITADTPSASSRPGRGRELLPSGERRRWTLMDLNGCIFEVADFPSDGDFVPALRKEMRETGLLEDDWTFLRLVIAVPPGPFRFNYSPEQNTVVATDVRGERYGNVYTRGPVERLPVHLRQFFLGGSVAPGQRFEGVLLFRPTLQPGAIDEVQMFIGGRLQTLYETPTS